MKSVILNRFTMQQFEKDAAGYLYDPRTRRFLSEVPETERTGIEALAAFGHAAKLIHLRMGRWSELHGLSEGRMRVLNMLRLQPERCLSMATIADWLRTTPRNVTGLVDHLEKDGYVERVADPNDRRSVLARLTPAGEAKIGSVWKAGLAHQATLTRNFTDDELAQLRHLCMRMIEQLQDAGRSDD